MRFEGGRADKLSCQQIELVGVGQLFRGTQAGAATANDKCEVLMHACSSMVTEENSATHDDKSRQSPSKLLHLVSSR